MFKFLENRQSSIVSRQLTKLRGFTLIELVVVIAIIGIMTAFVTVNFVGIRQRGRDTERKADLSTMQTALEIYRSDEGFYPTSLSLCGEAVSLSSGSVTYLKEVPCDPIDDTSAYGYISEPAACDNSGAYCTGYVLYACIENVNETDSRVETENPGGPNCPDGTAYFVVENP